MHLCVLPTSITNKRTSAQVAFLTACILQLPLSSVKISVLLFYKRIFAISRKLAVCTWIAIGVIAVWCITFTVVSNAFRTNDQQRVFPVAIYNG